MGALSPNITVASRVHVLEPQRNSAVEYQAIGRAVRLGREQNATNIRYVIEASVDQVSTTTDCYVRPWRLVLVIGKSRHTKVGSDILPLVGSVTTNKLLNVRFSHLSETEVLTTVKATFMEKQ